MDNHYAAVPIIVRASNIIDYIGENITGRSASDMIKKFDLPKTTCYRMLHTLVKYEFLLQDAATGLYYLGKKFSGCYTAMEHKFHILRQIAHPYLEKLSLQTQETSKISVLSGMSCYVLDKAEAPRNIKISVDAGAVFPLHAGAASKILFASAGCNARNILFSKGFERFTAKTITERDSMLAEFDKITGQGYSIDTGEYIEGIGAVACPVHDCSGEVIAAVSVAYATLNTERAVIESFIPLIKEAAQAVSKDFSNNHAGAALF